MIKQIDIKKNDDSVLTVMSFMTEVYNKRVQVLINYRILRLAVSIQKKKMYSTDHFFSL